MAEARRTDQPEHAEHARVVVSPHIGAVLIEGRNFAYAWDPFERKLVHGIQPYTVREAADRRAWMFENIGAYNSLPEPAGPWKTATDDYLMDLDTARRSVMRGESSGAPLDEEIRKSAELFKAMMAVSASARAMQRCSANPDTYLGIISLSPEKPNTDAADYMGSFMLHGNPEKYHMVIRDELVQHYYKQVLEDADIADTIADPEFSGGDPNPELHMINKRGEPIELDERGNPVGDERGEWVPSRVVIATSKEIKAGMIKEIRDAGRNGPGKKDKLIYYLHGGARNGGFDAYIRERLLKQDPSAFIEEGKKKKVTDAVRWAAARVACDAFLVDKFTRWNFQLTQIDRNGDLKTEREIYGSKDKLNLSPHTDWGGDPFTNLIQPTFLPRVIKRVYEGEASRILDIVDKGFRPDDIFFGNDGIKDDNGRPLLPNEILHPTATERFKHLIRYNEAVNLFFGSSRAAGLPEHNMGALKDSLNRIGELLAQVYGGIGTDSDPDLGKHVVGAMMSRLLLAKAAAARASMVNPPYFVDIFGPVTDPRATQPLRELREYLFGSRFDWRSGLIADLSSQRSRFIIRGNRFGGEEDIKLAYQILATPEESTLRKAGRAAVVVSRAFTERR